MLYLFSRADSPPAVGQPDLVRKGSSWVQISWDPVYCDGGFQINSYSVQYRVSRSFFSPYQTAASVAALNYTIRNLSPNTEYYFRVGSISDTVSRVVYSGAISIATQVAGIVHTFISRRTLIISSLI